MYTFYDFLHSKQHIYYIYSWNFLKQALLKEDWMIKTFTALLKFQLGPSETAPMKDNKLETMLSARWNPIYSNMCNTSYSSSLMCYTSYISSISCYTP